MMKQILFSCVGTSDPVRGEHDGPMLHILRHYRPESVYIFVTPEIRQLDSGDKRIKKTREWMREHWNGYQPAVHYFKPDIQNAHDLDALDKPLCDAMSQISRDNPDAEILINVTSGTPQMQMILSQMAMDMRYHAKGVQVANFEKKSGTSERANQKDYDIELELECNEDELQGAENRCVEPEMYAIRREFTRRQITALLDARNFEAVAQLKDSLPEKLGKLVEHMAARSRLQAGEAKRLAGNVGELPFKLYAYKTGSRTAYSEVSEYYPVKAGRWRREARSRTAYSEVSEYYLLMKNLVKSGNCTEFLLHLEPLTLTLQLALLDRLLQATGGGTWQFLSEERDRQFFDPAELQSTQPALYAHYSRLMAAKGWDVKRIEISTYLGGDLLSFYSDVPEKAKRLFDHYDMLKDLRNQLAHELRAFTPADIRAACGVDAAKLLEEIEGTIIACYPACDPVIFSVFDSCIEYIKRNL